MLAANWSRSLRGKPIQGVAAALLLLSVAVLSTYFTRQDMKVQAIGPYSEASDAMVREVDERFAPQARVAFFKPRALRWLTGRHGILIRDPAHLDVVDGVVLHPDAGTEFQLDRAQMDASPAFQLAWSNDHFLLYTRRLTDPRPTRP